jgi:pSer/pThr/pTyr-binding forkhead associated (FHA) protein
MRTKANSTASRVIVGVLLTCWCALACGEGDALKILGVQGQWAKHEVQVDVTVPPSVSRKGDGSFALSINGGQIAPSQVSGFASRGSVRIVFVVDNMPRLSTASKEVDFPSVRQAVSGAIANLGAIQPQSKCAVVPLSAGSAKPQFASLADTETVIADLPAPDSVSSGARNVGATLQAILSEAPGADDHEAIVLVLRGPIADADSSVAVQTARSQKVPIYVFDFSSAASEAAKGLADNTSGAYKFVENLGNGSSDPTAELGSLVATAVTSFAFDRFHLTFSGLPEQADQDTAFSVIWTDTSGKTHEVSANAPTPKLLYYLMGTGVVVALVLVLIVARRSPGVKVDYLEQERRGKGQSSPVSNPTLRLLGADGGTVLASVTVTQELRFGRELRDPISMQLSDEKQISRIQARTYVQDGELWLEDLESANGTKVRSPGQTGLIRLYKNREDKFCGPVRLNHGDRIMIGSAEIEVDLQNVAPAQEDPTETVTMDEDNTIV